LLAGTCERNPHFAGPDDCQWIDPLSYDLLEVIGRSIKGLRIFLLMAYRPPIMENVSSPGVSNLAYFSQINLAEFTPDEARQLIGLKIAQLFQGEASEELVSLISNRSEGNPFYIEELLNYVHDQILRLDDTGAGRTGSADQPQA
jgi:predicted ATPase